MNGLLAHVRLVASRIVDQPGMMVLRLAAMMSAVALVCAVGLYSSAIDDALLRANMARDAAATAVQVTQSGAPLDAAGYTHLDSYVRGSLSHDLDLPLIGLHAVNSTLPVAVYQATAAGRATRHYLGDAALEYYEGLAAHVQVVEGSLPRVGPDGTEAAVGRAVPVAVSYPSARALGLHLGSHVVLRNGPRQRLTTPLVVAALYVRAEPNSAFWASNAGPETYHALTLLGLGTDLSATRPNPWLQPRVYWYSQTRLDAVHYAAARTTLDRVQRASILLSNLAGGTVLAVGLTSDIASFLAGYTLLDPILYLLVAPVIVLILYAITVITGLAIEQRSRELVLLRSRGAGRGQLLGLTVLESLVVGAIAVALGPVLALPLAGLIGRCAGFLRFAGGPPIDLRLSPATFAVAALVAALALLAGLIPAVRVMRQPMTALLQSKARPRPRTLRHLALPVALLVAALYGYRVISNQGQIGTGSPATVLSSDPLVGASPLVFVLAVALTVTWLIPPAAALLFRLGLGQRLPPPLEMALQHLSRAPGLAVSLVRLLVLTMALGVFAASVAGVVAENTKDLTLFQAGATLRLEEWDRTHKTYAAYPLAWHLALPGVHAASLALRLESSPDVHIATDNGQDVNLLGVDPATLGSVIWWRPDLAAAPIAGLLHTVAARGPRALVSDSFGAATGLHPGDHFSLNVNGRPVALVVAGHTPRFPTLNPAVLPFVVANLDYLLAAGGAAAPSESWLRVDRSQPAVAGVEQVARQRANARLDSRQFFEYPGLAAPFSPADSPAQAGIYGVVSTGFAIAVLFALLGFVAHAAFAQKQRATEFAVLRALGFAPVQLRTLLLVEDVVLLAAGVAGGLLGGALASGLFVPYLPLAESTEIPFVVRVPWPELAGFSLGLLAVLLAVFGVSASMALRRRLAGALRLGE